MCLFNRGQQSSSNGLPALATSRKEIAQPVRFCLQQQPHQHPYALALWLGFWCS
jgi:hypothetical protein